MQVPNPKIIVSIIIIVVIVGILSFTTASNSKIGLNLSDINTVDKTNNSSNVSLQNSKTTNNSKNSTNENNQEVPYYIPNHVGLPNCPSCGSNNVVVTNQYIDKEGYNIASFECLYCGYEWTLDSRNH